MLRIYKFKRFGLLRREGVLLDGKCMDLTGFGFIPRLGWRYRHRRWLGIARVTYSGMPAQARQHTDSRMQPDYKAELKGKPMAEQNEHDRVTELLDELAEIGNTAYKAEYRDQVSKWRKIGMAISHNGQYGRECYELANAVAEDWNWHSMAAIVDFFLGVKPWYYTIDYLKSGIDGVYTLFGSDCKDRKVKLTLTVEDLDE